MIGADYQERLMADIELLDIAGDELDLERVCAGELTPVFFGSAINNFGVEAFLERISGHGPRRRRRGRAAMA